MDRKTRDLLFEKAPVPQAVCKLVVPTIISSLVMILYNMADTYFVGMLKDPVQNAAVTLAAPVLLAFNAVNNLFGIGCSSKMSRALGSKDYRTVAHCSSFGFWCTLLGGILFSLGCIFLNTPLLKLLGTDGVTREATRQYLFWTVSCGAAPSILNVVMANMVRSEGNTLNASIGTMSGCLLNMVLDPLFILPQGLNMGASGAGLATLISNTVACLYFFVYLFVKRKDTAISFKPKDFTLKRDIVLGVLAVGLPAAIQNLLNVTGMTVLNNATASYGSDAVAAMGIANKISTIAIYAAMGFSQGVMPLVGYTYASGNGKRMKETVVFTAKVMLTIIVSATVVEYVFASPLIKLFFNDQAIIAYGSRFLRGLCLALPFLCVDFLAVGVFQAVGMGKYALGFALARKIGLEIPALLILNKLFPLYGLAYAQLCAELVLSVLAVVILVRFFAKEGDKQPQV